MSNYCFLLAGTPKALDANRANVPCAPEPAVKTIAAQANTLPILWLQMFDAADLVAENLDEPDPEAQPTVALRTTRDGALARLSADPSPFAAIFPPGPALRQWCDLLATAVRECPHGVSIEADLTEYALLGPDPAEFAEELRTFLADIRRPPATSPPPRGTVARLLFGERPAQPPTRPAHDFIRNHCPELDPRAALPSPQDYHADPKRFGPILACLVGEGWDHPAPWERP